MNKVPLVIDYTLFKRKKNQPIRTWAYPVWELITPEWPNKDWSLDPIQEDILYKNSAEAEYAISYYLIMTWIYGPLPQERIDNIVNWTLWKEEELLFKKFNKDYRILPIWNNIYIKKKK